MKVFILEEFLSKEELEKRLEDSKAILDACATLTDLNCDIVLTLNENVTYNRKMVTENPNGVWRGFAGKYDGQAFLEIALEHIKRSKTGTYRVVVGEIENNAWTWLGYKNPVISETLTKELLKRANIKEVI